MIHVISVFVLLCSKSSVVFFFREAEVVVIQRILVFLMSLVSGSFLHTEGLTSLREMIG